MQADILPFYTPSTPGWGQKGQNIFVLKKVELHIKLKGKQCKYNVWPYAHPWPLELGNCADRSFKMTW